MSARSPWPRLPPLAPRVSEAPARAIDPLQLARFRASGFRHLPPLRAGVVLVLLPAREMGTRAVIDRCREHGHV